MCETIPSRVFPLLPPQVIIRMMDICSSPDLVANWSKKMAPPLVTLLGAEPEVQYVALRNINLIVQKRPVRMQAGRQDAEDDRVV